jgi:NadR type nicotinamide-nucleotide adenylyltransferase
LNLIRISITGPESTGKSWLTERLAGHFSTACVPEVSRDYLARLERPYEFDDIAKIAREQLAVENETAAKAKGLLFCDTDLLVCRIWSLFKYGKCDPWVARMTEKHRYDLYLLCNIDLPWEFDPLREHPGQREELFGIYRDELEVMKADYAIISGIGEERLVEAVAAVNKRFSLSIEH